MNNVKNNEHRVSYTKVRNKVKLRVLSIFKEEKI